MRSTIGSLLAGFYLLMLPSSVAADVCTDLVLGAIGRYHALTSGRITFKYIMDQRSYNREEISDFVFEGNNYSERLQKDNRDGRTTAMINYEGAYYEYKKRVSDPGTSHEELAGCHLEIRQSKPFWEGANYGNKPPIYAGSFWHNRQPKIFEENIDLFVSKGETQVNGINVHICEIAIDEENLIWFGGFRAELGTGGKIRLFIAPDYGYVIPRIEYRTHRDQLCQIFLYEEFELINGLWLPRKLIRMSPDMNDESKILSTSTFEILKYDMINKDVPDEEFIVDLPPTSRVRDFRDPIHPVAYHVQENSNSVIIAAALERGTGH